MKMAWVKVTIRGDLHLFSTYPKSKPTERITEPRISKLTVAGEDITVYGWIASRSTLASCRGGELLLERRSAKLPEQRNTRTNRVRLYWHDIEALIKHLHEICSLYIFSFRYLSLNKTIFENITSFCFVRFDDVLVSHFSENLVKIIRTSKQIAVNRLLTEISKLKSDSLQHFYRAIQRIFDHETLETVFSLLVFRISASID